MKKILFLFVTAVGFFTLTAMSEKAIVPPIDPDEKYPGGQTTHTKAINTNSFSHASANLNFKQELNFKVGNGFFRRLWVSSPSSTQAADGLGPLFNARGCQNCHIKDGRGHPPFAGEHAESLLLKLSIPAQNEAQQVLLDTGEISSIGDPVYGNQLQNFSVAGVYAEGQVDIDHKDISVAIDDDKRLILRQPIYQIINRQYGDFHKNLSVSPRVAPQMIGLGLLELIPEQDILALADPDDDNGDGISGKPNYVWSKEYDQLMLGRFGHKAGAPTLNQQNQNAFNNDIGISTPLNPNPYGDCTEAQQDCLDAPHGNSPQYENLEIHSEIAGLVLFYTRNLAVPERRDFDDENVNAGRALFYQTGCASCHHPSFVTGEDADSPQLSGQKIWPYTDMLLHDMGEALADNSPEGRANGREWRTAPLWGIGLTETVNDHQLLLHDGRANGVDEAIDWHGGEAANARNRFYKLSETERRQLIKFVNSL